MTGAGSLNERVTFSRFVSVEDEYGGQTGVWQDQFTAAASITWSRGGETVLAGRLQGKQSAILRIRTSAAARSVTPDWRVRDARTGEAYNIRERPREARDSRGYLEMLVEAGVP